MDSRAHCAIIPLKWWLRRGTTHIESAEVVALIARLVAEGKLKSQATKQSMSLQLAVNRGKFEGYERALIDALVHRREHPDLH